MDGMTYEQIEQTKWQFTQMAEKAKALYNELIDLEERELRDDDSN